MKNVLFSLFSAFYVVLVSVIGSSQIQAALEYTINEVEIHNNPNDCWMVIQNNVYDLSIFLSQHDDKLDIRSWCGKDATADYNSKYGKGQSHSSKADAMLKDYIIGSLNTNATIKPTTLPFKEIPGNITPKPIPISNGYSIILPLFGTIIVYLITGKILPKVKHNVLWNSVLLLGLIPSFGYGMVMALGKQFDWINTFRYTNMLTNHVELSVIFGTSCVLHFLNRLRIYVSQASLTIGKK